MKGLMLTLIIFTSLCISCDNKRLLRHSKESKVQFAIDSTRMLHGWQIEKELNKYFIDNEKMLMKEYSVKEEEINWYMQFMINEEVFERPFILKYDSGVLKVMNLSYIDYKLYRLNNPIDSLRDENLKY